MISGMVNGIFNWGMFTGIIGTLLVELVIGMILFIGIDKKDKEEKERKRGESK